MRSPKPNYITCRDQRCVTGPHNETKTARGVGETFAAAWDNVDPIWA
jgi:hypothetical protein